MYKLSKELMLPFIFICFIPLINGNRVVQTDNGPIRGITLDAKNVEAFLGIPYAEPPVGNLRFAKPLPKTPWTETFDAEELPPACLQPGMEFSARHLNQTSSRIDEDCLYLNLWVPKTETTLKTVMVYIHGGGFRTGSSGFEIYNGANLAQHGDVIVASMNYRLGILGFFSSFTEEAAGNMGLYDQLLAIKWIKNNAKYFGGDPNNIVIFGESSGAFATSLHMVSPLSKNLFKRAILQSASSITPMFSDNNEDLRNGSQIISTLVGCAANNDELQENPEEVIQCMKKLPPETFSETEPVPFSVLEMLLPRIGDEFLPMNPIDLFRKGAFKDTEVIFGVTADEGSMFAALQLGFARGDIFGERIDRNALNETSAREMARNILNRIKVNEKDHDEIIQSYFKTVKKESRYTYLNAISDIIGDALITCPTVFQANFQSLKKRPAYFYVFNYKSPSSPYPEWAGIPHFEEVQYVFGNPQWGTFSVYEEALSKDVMNKWVKFAKTGNPSVPGRPKWHAYTNSCRNYLLISMTDMMGARPDNFRCNALEKSFRSVIDREVMQNIKGGPSNRHTMKFPL